MKEKNIATFNIAGIKCDAEGCTFRDDTVKMKDYKSWLNKPCPLCGANLLTQADYDTVIALKSFTDLCNTPVIKQILKVIGNDKKTKFKVKLNGTGQVKFIEDK
ncbi:MAG: hypothetical protein NT096_00250 [Proteobacteria bacterium]|nr:hypothetical protein [Pseudomonadota bacterium]